MSGWLRLSNLLRPLWTRPATGSSAAENARGRRTPAKALKQLFARLGNDDPLVRAKAARELGRLGDVSAAERLIGHLGEPAPVGPEAVTALLSIGRPAIPLLLETLAGRNPLLSLGAADVLAQAGAPAVPGLLRQLTDPHRSDRQAVAEVLGRIGAPARPAVTALLHALLDKQESVRQAAAAALEKIDPCWAQSSQAEEAVPALVRGLTPLAHQPPAIAQIAANTLARIGAAAVPALQDALADDEHELRQIAAVRALARIGPAARAVVPALIDTLTKKAGPIRQVAAEALGEIGADAHPAVPALRESLVHWSEDVRRSAARALGKIGPTAGAALFPLLNALADATASVRRAAAETLEQLGPLAVPGLVGCLKHCDGDVRRAAARLLGKAGLASHDAVTTLVETLVDEYEPARAAAGDALIHLDPGWPRLPAAQAALPAVLQALAYRAEAVPHVLPATAAMGFAAVRRLAIPARSDWHVRLAAAETLGRIAVRHEDVLAALRAALDDEQPKVRQAATEALRQIETN